MFQSVSLIKRLARKKLKIVVASLCGLCDKSNMMLASMIRAYRDHEKISVRKLAKIIGIDHTTLFRFETGKEVNSSAWIKIVQWVLTAE